MKKTLARIAPTAILLALPVAAFAADIPGFLSTLESLMNRIVSFLIAVATLIFIFGIVRYIAAGGDADKTKEARGYIIFAIIGLVMIVGLWGFVNIVLGSLNLDKTIPTVEVTR